MTLAWRPPQGWTHAQCPTPLETAIGLDVYVSCRDGRGRSHLFCVDMSTGKSRGPLLSPGSPGTFDDCGVMASCALYVGEEIWLYYTGWNVMQPTPYRNTIGLAISRDGGISFERHSPAPLFERNAMEPYFFVTPWVLREENRWHLWYGCITGWEDVEGRFEPRYHIKYAHSKDGIHWVRDGVDCISPLQADEVNVRPCVRREGDIYKMWFCHRSARDYRGGAGSYRLGYAESLDGMQWTRHDYPITPTAGMDDAMQAYPAVAGEWLFYNGNGFGRDGFIVKKQGQTTSL